MGPSNLTTTFLKGETKIDQINCTPFESVTGYIVALLTEYIVNPDVEIVKFASEALYKILNSKEGQVVVGMIKEYKQVCYYFYLHIFFCR